MLTAQVSLEEFAAAVAPVKQVAKEAVLRAAGVSPAAGARIARIARETLVTALLFVASSACRKNQPPCLHQEHQLGVV